MRPKAGHSRQKGGLLQPPLCSKIVIPGQAAKFSKSGGALPRGWKRKQAQGPFGHRDFYYSPIWLKIQAVSTFFPCFFRERRAVLGERGTERWNRRVQGREQKRDNEQFTPGATDKPHTVWCGACHLYNAKGGHKKSPRTEVRGKLFNSDEF